MNQKNVIDLKELLGDPTSVQKELLQFHCDCVLLDNKLIGLTEQYPDQWAGAYHGEVTIAPTLEELIEKMGDRARHMAWCHLSTEPINWTLLAA